MQKPRTVGARVEVVELGRSEVRAVAERLETMRGEYGSNKAIAAELGIGNQLVGVLARHPAALNISAPVLDRIAAHFGIDRAELLRGKARAA